MTIYSGKDAKVYLGDYELPYVSSFNVEEPRRRFVYQTYQGAQKRFKAKSLVAGSITVYDLGLPYLLHFMPYYTIDSTKLTAKWSDDRISIGFPFPSKCDTYTTVYNTNSTTITLDIPSSAIGDTITFKTIHIYIDGIGTPNSAVYTVELRQNTNIKDSETFTWTTNTARWISLTTIEHTNSSSTGWNINITTTDAGTNATNCQRVWKLAATEYPFFTTDTGCCILEIEDWLQNTKKIDITLEVSTNYTASIDGVVWGVFGKTYTAGEMNSSTISYTADSVDWIET
jgi:hypothetical protein